MFDTLFGSILTSFEAPEATKLTAFEAPHARLGIGCVRGCYLKQNLSRKGPKKAPKCDYFLGPFFEASPKALFWFFGVKMGSRKIPKINFFGTPATLRKLFNNGKITLWVSLEGVFLRNAFWGPFKTTLFMDVYIYGGPDGTQKLIKKRP